MKQLSIKKTKELLKVKKIKRGISLDGKSIKKLCSICKRYYTGWGNNAQPLNKGRCCDFCNASVVAARIIQIEAGIGLYF